MTSRICKHCGKPYTNIYLTGGKYKYTVETLYCSRSCKSISSRTGCIMPDRGRGVLEAEIKDHVLKNGRYTSADEILTAIRCSTKSLTKHGLKILQINNDLGFYNTGSMFEEKVYGILKNRFDEIIRQKSFDGLVGNTGYPLRVDFYLPALDIVIEADGKQHISKNHQWSKFKNGTVIEYDEIKNRFCHENGIKLIRIPYKERLTRWDVYKFLDDF